MIKITKKTVPLFFILLFAPNTQAKNVVQMSMPKAGTYLLMKCVSALTGVPTSKITTATAKNYRAYYEVDHNEFRATSQRAKHWVTHLFFNDSFVPFLNNDKTAFFFIYRDPRDQLVSFAYFMLKIPRWSKEASAIPFDNLIMRIIVDGSIYQNSPPCEDINDIYQRYIPWLSDPHVCSIRFEDLVGPKGGGDAQAQLIAVRKIADHLGITASDKKIQKMANSLFGGTGTFRKGQIGSWKKHFNEDHKKAFKEVAGQLLIDLGYEESFDW